MRCIKITHTDLTWSSVSVGRRRGGIEGKGIQFLPVALKGKFRTEKKEKNKDQWAATRVFEDCVAQSSGGNNVDDSSENVTLFPACAHADALVNVCHSGNTATDATHKPNVHRATFFFSSKRTM